MGRITGRITGAAVPLLNAYCSLSVRLYARKTLKTAERIFVKFGTAAIYVTWRSDCELHYSLPNQQPFHVKINTRFGTHAPRTGAVPLTVHYSVTTMRSFNSVSGATTL